MNAESIRTTSMPVYPAERAVPAASLIIHAIYHMD
jgi:hypothetical protein